MSASTAFAGSWSSLPDQLTPWILHVIQSMGHTQMTPVQASTIPLFMRNKDVVVEAVTGSGKTLAFVVPIMERLIRKQNKLRKNEVGALVICPTRELANQIHSVFQLFFAAQPNTQSLSCPSPLSPGDLAQPTLEPDYPPPLLLISSGQSSPAQDVQRFLSTGADIVIGTPGRVEEFILGKGRSVVSMRELDVLVLDEADRLLDLGFQATLTRILTHLPKQRRTGLFSATMTDADALSELVRVSLRNPARIVVTVQSKKVKSKGDQINGTHEIVEERRIPVNLQNFYLTCHSSEKVVQLTRIIALEVSRHLSQFIVYFATCACVDYFYGVLPSLLPKSTTLYSLHGNLPPAARSRTLANFCSAISTPSSVSVLLATDVAARGLDLPHVDVVIQFDTPSDPKAFSHRCGRTARAGRSGRAWVLLVGRETEYVDFMAVRRIPLQEQPYIDPSISSPVGKDGHERPEDSAVLSFLAQIRKTLLTDRALHDKAAKAFVSFVKAYSKHEASYIFRVKDLDLIGVAKSFGLLRLPKMPEFKDRSRGNWEDAKVDWDTYAYVNKAREAKRLTAGVVARIARDEAPERLKAKRSESKQSNSAWSNQVHRKEARDLRKEKKTRKRTWLASQVSAVDVEENGRKKAGNTDGDSDDDWEELVREERMAKKARMGEISQRVLDEEFGDL